MSVPDDRGRPGSPVRVSRWQGHANVSTTDAIYAHLYVNDNAAEREEVGRLLAAQRWGLRILGDKTVMKHVNQPDGDEHRRLCLLRTWIPVVACAVRMTRITVPEFLDLVKRGVLG